jgi:tRNA G18 (ribose-2'-O)-methylase SpoU
MGHVLALPFAVLTDWPGGLERLHAAGYLTVALTPAADAVDLADVDARAHPRTAVLLGAEGPGLTPEALAAAGRDVETLVLARAVRWHAEHRVLLNGHRTVVFR